MTNFRAVERQPSPRETILMEGGITSVREWSAGYPAGFPQCRSVRRAFECAAGKLAGKTRGQYGEMALWHSVRVAKVLSEVFGVRGCRITVTALLHDVLEDSDTDYDEIEEAFGAPVADAVVLLTKPKFYPKPLRKEIYESALLSAHEEVLLVKLADLYDNLQSRRGRKRVCRTWKSAQRLLEALSARHLGARTRRATKIMRDLLANLEREEPSIRAIQVGRSEEITRVAA